MGLIPDPRSMMTLGATRAFRGLRTGDQRLVLLGAALAAVGWFRKSAASEKTLIHRSVVREGTSLVIRSGDQSRIEVRRVDDETAT